MWLHVPSASAPEPGCSTSASTLPPNEQALAEFALSATLSGKHTRPQTWSRKWKQEPWLKLLSGLTLEPSQAQSAALTWAQQAWMPSLAESPASHSPSQESGFTPMTPGTSLERPWNSLKPLLLNGSPWRTSQGSLFLTDSADSQKDWTSWATTWRQSCSALVTWGPRMDELGCLSSLSLEWRTPSAGDPEGGVMEIRTDTTGKYKLRDDSVAWATPQAFDSKDVTRKTPTTVAGCRTLANDLVNWATPNAEMDKQDRATDATLYRCYVARPNAQKALPPEARFFSLPQRTTPPHGSAPCTNDRTSALRYRALRLMRGTMKHRLNPLFAEWLMGWPEQWSNVQADSGSLATEWFLYKQQLRTAFSLMLSEGRGE